MLEIVPVALSPLPENSAPSLGIVVGLDVQPQLTVGPHLIQREPKPGRLWPKAGATSAMNGRKEKDL